MNKHISYFTLLVIGTLGGLHLVDHVFQIPHSDSLLMGGAIVVLAICAIFVFTADISRDRE